MALFMTCRAVHQPIGPNSSQIGACKLVFGMPVVPELWGRTQNGSDSNTHFKNAEMQKMLGSGRGGDVLTKAWQALQWD